MYEFMNNHYLVTLILGVSSMYYATWVIGRLFRLPVLLIYGYPPEHCDADGDFKKEPEKEDQP